MFNADKFFDIISLLSPEKQEQCIHVRRSIALNYLFKLGQFLKMVSIITFGANYNQIC